MLAAITGVVERHIAGKYSLFIEQQVAIIAAFICFRGFTVHIVSYFLNGCSIGAGHRLVNCIRAGAVEIDHQAVAARQLLADGRAATRTGYQ